MLLRTFKKFSAFKNYYDLKQLKRNFCLPYKYIYRDESLYTNDEKVKWMVFEEFDIPLAILCTSKEKEDTHILIFEVNSNFRNNGIGKKVLEIFQTKVLKNKPVTLICKKEVTGFFKKIGFEILENKGNSNLMKKNYN